MRGADLYRNIEPGNPDVLVVFETVVWYMCTMLVHRVVLPMTPIREFRKELQYLYERRSAVEALIRSLEEYARYQPRHEKHRPRKTA